jgi:hypothetical protein
MIDWRVGMRAVCIKDDWHNSRDNTPADAPRKGSIYIVADVIPKRAQPGRGEAGLHFEEVPGWIWWHRNFRPLVEPSIKVFEDNLARLPKTPALFDTAE